MWAKGCILDDGECVLWLGMTTPHWWREKVMVYYIIIIIISRKIFKLIANNEINHEFS